MKQKTLILLCFLLLNAACKKIRKLTYFNYSQSVEFTIPSVNAPGQIAIPTPPTKSNAQTSFQNNGTETKYVQEVKLNSMTLSTEKPAGQNFNFLNSIHIFISAPGQNDTLLAYRDSVPLGVTQFPLQTTGTLLDPYVEADTYTIRVETVTDEVLTYDVKIKADMVFRVRANVLKK